MTGPYPRTIRNPAGEELTFVNLVSDPAGDILELSCRVQPGCGPGMHAHYLQEEALTVREGTLGYQRPGTEPQYAAEGETVVFLPGEAHRFWNAGNGELRCTGWVKPAHNAEYFLTALYRSMEETGQGRPSAFDAAFLLTRYRSEFGMPTIPGFVRSFIFPLQVAIGKALGKFEKFRDAPEPVQG